MFWGAKSFNSDLSQWGVSNVEDMGAKFMDATAFSIDISKWDVSSVTDLDNRFWQATWFKQNLCGTVWVDTCESVR